MLACLCNMLPLVSIQKKLSMSARWKFVLYIFDCPIYLFLTLYKRQKSSTTFWLNLLDFLPTLDITIKSQNKCLPFTNWHVFTTFVWGCSIDKSKPVKRKHPLVLVWIKLIPQWSLTTHFTIYYFYIGQSFQ